MVQEWTVYDSETQKMTLTQAQTQEEAIRKSVNNDNVIPRRSTAARPRTGDSELMTRQEFNDFMDAGLV